MIPFHPIVATAEMTTTLSILNGTKSEPSQPHPKSKQHLPNLPPLPEPKPEPQEFEMKLEPAEPEQVPESEFEMKLEPPRPEPQFVQEELETKLETEEPEPGFTIPITPDSTTPESSMHQLSVILHHPEEEFIPPPLEGIKKFGTCRGSFICLNDDRSIYTAEHMRNRVDFTKEKFGTYSCSNCKVFVQCRQCNAQKVTEFDQKDNVLTIYHQGKHICTPKPDVEKQRQVAAEKCKEPPTLNLELRNTP